MYTKTYDKKTAAFAGWLIQNVPADLDDETMDNWMNNPDGTKKFLSGLKPPKTRQSSLFSIAATTPLDAVAGKKTNQCFPIGERYAYRDNDFDNWLPANQPNADACVITTLVATESWTFAEAAARVLGIGAGTSILMLGDALIQNGHTMTLAQVEEMVEKTENGVKTEMRVDGYGNFFFVETEDPKNPVSVGNVVRDGRDWGARVRRLARGYRWRADIRLLVRNLEDA